MVAEPDEHIFLPLVLYVSGVALYSDAITVLLVSDY